MAYYDGLDDSVASNISLIIGAYADERQEYWSDEPREASLVHMCDLVAEALLSSTMDVVFLPDEEEAWKKEPAPWARVREVANEHGFGRHLAQSVEIHLANETVESLSGSTARCLDLAKYVLSGPPGESVRRYLSRLGRCYVAGFLPECVIICRAVLETMLNETIDRHGEVRPSRLEHKIDEAAKKRWITLETKKRSHVVRLRGNKAIHQDPTVTQEVLETIEYTMEAVRELAQS